MSARALETTHAASQAQDLLSIYDKLFGRDRSTSVLASVGLQSSYRYLLPATECRNINA
ncbi:MAG TPA: hypothetical protein QF564_02000 [Pirellulaceae bacterium]|nr:hypothetical protein [Pirellulaceae bacterium]